jgi:hypothetical protein
LLENLLESNYEIMSQLRREESKHGGPQLRKNSSSNSNGIGKNINGISSMCDTMMDRLESAEEWERNEDSASDEERRPKHADQMRIIQQ